MSKLKYLNIYNTDINEGVRFLPDSLEKVGWSFKDRDDCKLKEIESDLESLDLLIKSRNENSEKELIPFSEFSKLDFIAEGGFSKIYKSKWKHLDVTNKQVEEEVVLKTFEISLGENYAFKEFSILKLLDDPSWNILSLLGITKDLNLNEYYLVMDYYKKGDLRKNLKDGGFVVSLEEKFWFLSGIIDGMKCIHSKNFVHRDLHPGNILLKPIEDECFLNNPKKYFFYPTISDMGLSSLWHEKNRDKLFGIIPYVAPEILMGESYTKASDVYSFGMIMYEVLTGCVPFHNDNWDSNLSLKIINGYRPKIIVKLVGELEEIINNCWSHNPNERPKFIELRNKFEKIGNDENFVSKLCLKEYNSNYQSSFQNNKSISYHSKIIDTKELIEKFKTQILENGTDNNSNKMIKFKEKLTEIKKQFSEEVNNLINQFIKLIFQLEKAETEDEELVDSVEEVEKQLENYNVNREILSNFEDYCKKLAELEISKEYLICLIEN